MRWDCNEIFVTDNYDYVFWHSDNYAPLFGQNAFRNQVGNN